MDLVDYSEERFREIEAQIKELSEELSLANVKIIPVSATEGDNVTTKSDNIKWYDGEALLTCLGNIDISEDDHEVLYAGTACMPSGPHIPRLSGAGGGWRDPCRRRTDNPA